jgi:hypothetical protein
VAAAGFVIVHHCARRARELDGAARKILGLN